MLVQEVARNFFKFSRYLTFYLKKGFHGKNTEQLLPLPEMVKAAYLAVHLLVRLTSIYIQIFNLFFGVLLRATSIRY